MITVKVTKKTKDVLIDMPNHIKKHKRALEMALYDTGADIVKETKRLIETGPKTGRIYRYKGRPHQASAPGEAPANRSGRLAKSGDYKVRNWHEMVVGETAYYAGFLEDGTRKRANGKGGIIPRPHLIRAINSNAQNLVQNILENVNKELGV